MEKLLHNGNPPKVGRNVQLYFQLAHKSDITLSSCIDLITVRNIQVGDSLTSTYWMSNNYVLSNSLTLSTCKLVQEVYQSSQSTDNHKKLMNEYQRLILTHQFLTQSFSTSYELFKISQNLT